MKQCRLVKDLDAERSKRKVRRGHANLPALLRRVNRQTGSRKAISIHISLRFSAINFAVLCG